MNYNLRKSGDMNSFKYSENSLSLDYELVINSTHNSYEIFNEVLKNLKNEGIKKIPLRKSNQSRTDIGNTNLVITDSQGNNVKFGYNLYLTKNLLDFLKDNISTQDELVDIVRDAIYESIQVEKNAYYVINIADMIRKEISKNTNTDLLKLFDSFNWKETNFTKEDAINEHIKDNLHNPKVVNYDLANSKIITQTRRVIIDEKIAERQCITEKAFLEKSKEYKEIALLIGLNLSKIQLSQNLQIKIKVNEMDKVVLISLIDEANNKNLLSSSFKQYYEKINNLNYVDKKELLSHMSGSDFKAIDVILSHSQQHKQLDISLKHKLDVFK